MQDPSACIAPANAVLDAMSANAAAYTAASSADAVARALHAARVVSEAAQAIATNRQSRDAAMAENAEWYAARDKVILVGHQTHFGRSPYFFNNPSGTKSAGGYLADALGSAADDRLLPPAAAAVDQRNLRSSDRLIGRRRPASRSNHRHRRRRVEGVRCGSVRRDDDAEPAASVGTSLAWDLGRSSP